MISNKRRALEDNSAVARRELKNYLLASEASKFIKDEINDLKEVKAYIHASVSDQLKLLKLEYNKTQEMVQHYDDLNWDIGLIL